MFSDSISVNFTVTIDPELERASGLADHTDYIKVLKMVVILGIIDTRL